MNSDIVIRVENLSKRYRLGLVGGTTLREDLNRWWAKLRGRPDPTLPVTHTGQRTDDGGQTAPPNSHNSPNSLNNNSPWKL